MASSGEKKSVPTEEKGLGFQEEMRMKRRRDVKRAAELVLALNTLGEMRYEPEPTAVERELMAEAQGLVASLCGDFAPKDLFPPEVLDSAMKDMGLTPVKNILRSQSSKMSIAEHVEKKKRKSFETCFRAAAGPSYASPTKVYSSGGQALHKSSVFIQHPLAKVKGPTVPSQASITLPTQTRSGHFAIMPQHVQGINIAQCPSSNLHTKISILVQDFLRPHIPKLPMQILPPTDYMRKSTPCQVCKVTIKEVENVLICDACEEGYGYHKKCLESQNQLIVRKDHWHCFNCLSSSNRKPLLLKYGRVTREGHSSTAAVQSSQEMNVEKPGENKNKRRIIYKGCSGLKSPAEIMGNSDSNSEIVFNLPIGREAHGNGILSKRGDIDDNRRLVNYSDDATKWSGSGCTSVSVGLSDERAHVKKSVSKIKGQPRINTLETGSKMMEVPSNLSCKGKEVLPDKQGVSRQDEKAKVPYEPIVFSRDTMMVGVQMNEQSDISENVGLSDERANVKKSVSKAKGQPLINTLETGSIIMEVPSNLSRKGKEVLSDKQSVSRQDDQAKIRYEPTVFSRDSIMVGVQMNVRSDISDNVDWIGDVLKVSFEKIYYQSCSVDGVVYKVHDHALLPTCNSAQKFTPFKLQAMWEDSNTRCKWVTAHKCYFRDDLPTAVGHPLPFERNEVCESNYGITIMAGLIRGPCEVVLPVNFAEESQRRSLLKSSEKDGLRPLFLCKWYFDQPERSFRDVSI